MRSEPHARAELAAALNAAVSYLSQPSDVAVVSVHHGYRQALVVTSGRLVLAEFAALVADFHPVREAWLSWIEPGGYVVDHVDAGPHYERWQIPFTAAGQLVVDDEPLEHAVGVPFRVEHHRWHRVDNDSDEPRVSLVIDRDAIVASERTPFRTKG